MSVSGSRLSLPRLRAGHAKRDVGRDQLRGRGSSTCNHRPDVSDLGHHFRVEDDLNRRSYRNVRAAGRAVIATGKAVFSSGRRDVTKRKGFVTHAAEARRPLTQTPPMAGVGWDNRGGILKKADTNLPGREQGILRRPVFRHGRLSVRSKTS